MASAAPPSFLLRAAAARAARGGAEHTLAALLAPLTLPDFLATYRGRWPFASARQQPDYYAGLLSLRDFDYLCAYSGLRPDDVEVVVAQGDTKVNAPLQTTPAGALDVGALYEHYSRGATIVLHHLEVHWEAVARLVRDAALALQRPLGVNAYLTPAHVQGFPVHFDTHDVFILQLDGTKCWKVYAPAVTAPLPDLWFPLRGHALGAPLHELELQAGDLLYLPRGYVHEARATTAVSLHLTVRSEPLTWLDLLTAAVADAAARSEWRQELPAHYFDGSPDSRAQFRRLLRAFAEQAGFDEALARLADQFLDRLCPLPTGHLQHLADLARLQPDTVLKKRPGMLCHIREAGAG